jgi:ferredoxin
MDEAGRGGGSEDDRRARVVVEHGEETTEVAATPGEPLRDALLAADLSPYSGLTARANCGGRGLCATCGVRLRGGHEPGHWHDRLAARFGYPRLSCQVPVADGMVVELLPEKRVWGGRE